MTGDSSMMFKLQDKKKGLQILMCMALCLTMSFRLPDFDLALKSAYTDSELFDIHAIEAESSSIE